MMRKILLGVLMVVVFGISVYADGCEFFDVALPYPPFYVSGCTPGASGGDLKCPNGKYCTPTDLCSCVQETCYSLCLNDMDPASCSVFEGAPVTSPRGLPVVFYNPVSFSCEYGNFPNQDSYYVSDGWWNMIDSNCVDSSCTAGCNGCDSAGNCLDTYDGAYNEICNDPGQGCSCDFFSCTDNSDCDDSNPCTDNVCSSNMCTYPNLADGTVCDTDHVCQSGVCTPSLISADSTSGLNGAGNLGGNAAGGLFSSFYWSFEFVNLPYTQARADDIVEEFDAVPARIYADKTVVAMQPDLINDELEGQEIKVYLYDVDCNDFDLYTNAGYYTTYDDIVNNVGTLIATEADLTNGYCQGGAGVCSDLSCGSDPDHGGTVLSFTVSSFSSYGVNGASTGYTVTLASDYPDVSNNGVTISFYDQDSANDLNMGQANANVVGPIEVRFNGVRRSIYTLNQDLVLTNSDLFGFKTTGTGTVLIEDVDYSLMDKKELRIPFGSTFMGFCNQKGLDLFDSVYCGDDYFSIDLGTISIDSGNPSDYSTNGKTIYAYKDIPNSEFVVYGELDILNLLSSTPPPTPIPEFSNIGVLLAIIIIAAGGLFIARRRD